MILTHTHYEGKRVEICDLDKPHQKYILKDGTEVTGVTTILQVLDKGGDLTNWIIKTVREGGDPEAIKVNAGRIGTAAHFLCESYLGGYNAQFEGLTQEQLDVAILSFGKFKSYWEASGYTLVHSEVQLVSETYKYGGTIDCIVKDQDGNLGILDIKTSTGIYDGYIMQLAAYFHLYAENYGEGITDFKILRIGKEDPEDFHLLDIPADMIEVGWKLFQKANEALKLKKELNAIKTGCGLTQRYTPLKRKKK